MKFDVYCDGSTTKNGKTGAKGGYGIVILCDEAGIHQELFGQVTGDKVTNQVCELTAAIYAIETILNNFDNIRNPDTEITIYSDSAYLINCFKDHWYINWENNGWVNAKKQPVANKELWQRLIKYHRSNTIHFEKVRGHADNEYNNRADKLARLGGSSNA